MVRLFCVRLANSPILTHTQPASGRTTAIIKQIIKILMKYQIDISIVLLEIKSLLIQPQPKVLMM